MNPAPGSLRAVEDMRRVTDIMDRDLLPISPEETCDRALAIMEAAGIDDLPVLEGYRLVGMVNELDIRRRAPQEIASPGHAVNQQDLFPHVRVSGVMTYGPPTIRPHASLTEAVELMRDREVRSLPVVEDGRLVGVLTIRTLLNALIDLLANHRASSVGI